MSADFVRTMNAAIAGGDVDVFVGGCRPDAVWEHNPGGGSPEEGTYEGRDEIRRLFERVLEGWDYMRPEITEVSEAAPGEFVVRGDLHCGHPAVGELVVPYEQHLEIRDGLMARGRMTFGALVP